MPFTPLLHEIRILDILRPHKTDIRIHLSLRNPQSLSLRHNFVKVVPLVLFIEQPGFNEEELLLSAPRQKTCRIDM